MRRGPLTFSTGALGSKYRAPSDSRRRKLPMRYARILSIGLIATVAFAWSAAAIENADELAGYCQSLERGAKGAGRHIYIPSTREALTCWGYMQAMCSPMKTGAGLWALVRRSRRRRCSSFDRSSAMRARIAANFRTMLWWRCSERSEGLTRAALSTETLPARRKNFHARQNNPPVDHRPRRWRTRRTCIRNHWPPFGAAMPRALTSVAMALLDVRPALMQRSMCGR